MRRVLMLNPMASLVSVYRDVMFTGRVPEVETWLTALLVGVVAWWLGAKVFSYYRETLVEAV